MSKIQKSVLILIDLLFVTAILPVILHSIKEIGFQTKIISISKISYYLDEYIPLYLFFGSVTLLSVLLILLLVLIFYPKKYSGILFRGMDGKFFLKKSAIEAFVKEALKDNGYIKNSKINIFLGRKKIKILVKGEVIPRFEVLQKTILIENEIRNGLKEFLGLENSVLFKVKVNAIAPKDKKSKRVL